MKQQTAVRYNSKKEFFAIIDYFYKKGILPKVETFRGVITKYDYAFYEKNYNYYKDNCTCIVLDPLSFIGSKHEHKYNVISFNEFNKKNRQMKQQTITLPKGMTANEINVCVEDGKIMVSYEVEPIKPEYKCGDILDLGDGNFITLIDWNGGCDTRAFYGVNALYEDRAYIDRCEVRDSGWQKVYVKGLATPEQVFQYHKAFKDAGYEWDSEKMEFVEYVWKPKKGEDYYYVDREGQIRCLQNTEHHTDFRMYNFNNYFRTKEAAQVAADQIKEVLKNARKE